MKPQGRPYAMDTGWQREIHGDLDGEALYRYAVRLEAELAAANAEIGRLEREVDRVRAELHASTDRECVCNAKLAAANALLAKATEFRIGEYAVRQRHPGEAWCVYHPTNRLMEWRPTAAEAVKAAEEAQGEMK